MQTPALLLIGFSVVAAVILAIAYLFFLDTMQKTVAGKTACAVLLFTLAALQLEHLRYFHTGADLLATQAYAFLLMLAPTAFFFFSREILLGGAGLNDHAGHP